MTISEPATLITDYLLAAFTAALSWRLLRASRTTAAASGSMPSDDGRWWWALAFALSAVAAFTGGTVHGFQHALVPRVLALLWLVTLEALVFGSFAVVSAALHTSRLRADARRKSLVAAGVLYAIYGVWIARRAEFVYAIAAYGASLIVLLPLQLFPMHRARGWRWLLAGVAASAAAAIVQQSGWALHRHFNHNDLYHVIQAGSVWMLYRGAMISPPFLSGLPAHDAAG